MASDDEKWHTQHNITESLGDKENNDNKRKERTKNRNENNKITANKQTWSEQWCNIYNGDNGDSRILSVYSLYR